ncbi:ABC transporter G family member 5 isoform X1 [Lycium barbarum]|uniref:ABC transporter G family member 5 isoform X1 n=1 Tax=Lycium barbarum TaxID=112863 RepID=UPI00293E778E|nr:ABC transporter G family member 5 isoform X1 [Lycium barbarum]
MKKQGCEIEAIGINYTIYTQKRDTPFNFFRRNQHHKCSSGVQELHEVKELEKGNNPKATRHVLKDVKCRAKSGEILAIVGPSGAGKSTFLEVLAGKIEPESGSIFVNQKPVDKARFKKISGYVTQKDTLFPLLTVQETLSFSANLRLKLPAKELNSRVKCLIQELGLQHVAGARIGDDRIRGISGGERRRVSIGVELIHDPRVLILDEPTSGLDSTSALQIIDMLKTMAVTRGRTIILSIHQPCFRIMKLFNSILLLANGAILHHGTIEQLSLRLILMGLQLPLHVNILEFAIESIDIIQKQSHTLLPQSTLMIKNSAFAGKSTLQQLFQESKLIDEESMPKPIHNDFPSGFANSRLQEIVILTIRFCKIIYRTKELFGCKTLQMLVSGLVLGSVFYNLEQNLVGAQARVGLFAFILTYLLSSTTEALPIFLQEREILMKETSCGSYRVSSYVIANSLVYLPFLLILALLFSTPLYWMVGLKKQFMAFMHFLLLIWLTLYTANSVVVCCSALVPNFIIGNSLVCAVMGSCALFSGYFVSKNEIPNYWIGMHYVSLFKYPFEGFLINEFSGSGKCLQYMFGMCLASGEQVLKEEGYGGEGSRRKNLLIMVCFILLYRFISYVILRVRCSQGGGLKKILISR